MVEHQLPKLGVASSILVARSRSSVLISRMSETAKITVTLPKGCTRTKLGVDALDKITRDLAYATHIYVDGKLLLCRSFEVKDGHLLLKVMPECFEIVEDE
jgi:hypothetical protein